MKKDQFYKTMHKSIKLFSAGISEKLSKGFKTGYWEHFWELN